MYGEAQNDIERVQSHAAPSRITPLASPVPHANEREIEEINREIEAIAADDFFIPLSENAGASPMGSVARAPFYRELE